MTIVEQIVREAEALPPKDRHDLLNYARTMRAARSGKRKPAVSTQKHLGNARKILRGVNGMWKDRTDLPNIPSRDPKTIGKLDRKEEEVYVPKDPALRAIAGMWKDRTDLPKDPVHAVKVLRARMRARGRIRG